jgi:predicted phosphohydrolase
MEKVILRVSDIMKPTDFYLVTDTHFFKNSLGAYGKEYEKFMRNEQKCFAETEAINKAVFKFLEENKDTDNILFAGDLSFNGEKESHLAFIEMLKGLKASGKNVYVITAGHDYNDNCLSYDNDGKHHIEGTRRNELYDLYYEFGFKDAIAVDRKHLSYVAQLSDGVRLLALNNDGNCDDFQTYDDEQIKWIKKQTKKARADNQMMFAMNHYPLIAGQPIFSLVPSAVQKNAGEITEMLADEGVHLVFTGHMHNQSINEKVSKNGNKFYDVCTGSIIASPAVIRFVTIEDKNTVTIKTVPTPDFEWNTGDRSCKQYLADLFDSMILNMISDMKENPKVILDRFGAGDKEKLYPLVRFLGKKFDTFTVGKICRLFCVKCDKKIRNMLLKNYIAQLVRNLFSGNQPFVEGTPEGDALLGVLKRLNPILKKIHLKNTDGEAVDLFDILKNSAGNYGIDDYSATLILNN